MQLVDVEADSIRWPDGVGDNKCTAFVDSWVALDYPYYSYLKGCATRQGSVLVGRRLNCGDSAFAEMGPPRASLRGLEPEAPRALLKCKARCGAAG